MFADRIWIDHECIMCGFPFESFDQDDEICPDCMAQLMDEPLSDPNDPNWKMTAKEAEAELTQAYGKQWYLEEY